MKPIFLTLLLCFCSSFCIAQKIPSLTEDIFYKKHSIITIESYFENNWRKELHIIYISDGPLKIHSIIKTQDRIIDTMFALNNLQTSQLDTFGNKIKNGVLPKGIVFGGTLITYEIQFPNGEKINKEGNVDYSLFDALIYGPEFHKLKNDRILQYFKKYKSK